MKNPCRQLLPIFQSFPCIPYESIITKKNGECNLDFLLPLWYNTENFIGQFVTILSVNKTRETGWALCALFCGRGLRPFLL